MDRIGIIFEAPIEMQYIIESLAIKHGVTKDEMMSHLFTESETFRNNLSELNLDEEDPEIETKEEFDKRFRKALQDTVKNCLFSDNEISILKKAYYFFQMIEGSSLTAATPHDKSRYKKYENAISTIEEMLTITNHQDKEYLLLPLQETYNILIRSKMDYKKHYKQKMNEELDKLILSKYAKANIIDTFKNSL